MATLRGAGLWSEAMTKTYVEYAPNYVGPMGFETHDSNMTIAGKVLTSKRMAAVFANEDPVVYRQREARPIAADTLKKWEDFQLSKGRERGSNDMTLLTEWIFGERWSFLPQDIGSCVYSNMFRAWISRMCWEIVLLGDLEKWTGTGQFGINSIAPHCVQYGFAREIANMKGGDGLYCAPMIKSLQRGIVTCSTPAVKALHEQNNAAGDTNYPEPRSSSLFRKIGDWDWNNALRPYLQCALRESVEVTNPDQHAIQDSQSKPMIMCSGLAFKKIGRHKDGFDIHGIDPDNGWSHNTAFEGHRVSSDKNRFTRLHTISWVRPGEDPEKQCFNLPPEELAKVYRKDVDVASLGEIEGMPIASPSL